MSDAKKKQQVAAEKKRQTPSGKRDKYFQKLHQIEASLSDLEYLTKDGVTSELIEAESERYERWDDALNEIYGVLKTQLSESEMNALRKKQRAWIAYRDRTANAEGAKFAGGSAEPLAYIGTMATLTEERCYELVEEYMR
ncbi:lysozyme inhibitor LprI family protein [Sporosarcina sp. FSL K6-1508]|uniref:lysozyme inhibitor LprI family protein n=1 Tax=Sporosarcina sp. FSL K6-1508 TaxID=2921553 RepID=UPI0030F4D143